MLTTRFHAKGVLGWLALLAAARPASAAGPIDFPLALKTQWTYHIRQEVGEGVHFGEEDAKLAKGNVLDATVVSTITGHDIIAGAKYARVESQRDGRLYLTEWYASGPAGLLLARIVEAGGGDNVMSPPQKLLIPSAAPGAVWSWKDTNKPISMTVKIVGTGALKVPAGTYQAVETSHDTSIRLPEAEIRVKQSRWYAAGVGYVKEDTETRVGPRLLSHIVLTLEKFEPAQ